MNNKNITKYTKPVYIYTTYPVENSNDNPVDEFKSIVRKSYKVLSAEDVMAIDLIKKEGVDTGIDYYVKARNANREQTANRLNIIFLKLDDYRIYKSKYLAANLN